MSSFVRPLPLRAPPTSMPATIGSFDALILPFFSLFLPYPYLSHTSALKPPPTPRPGLSFRPTGNLQRFLAALAMTPQNNE